MLCHLFLGYNRVGIFFRHRPFALRSRSLSLARQLKGLHGGVGLFWKNPPMPLYWLARKWWAKTAPCPTAMQHSRAPSTGSGSGGFLLRRSPSAEPVAAMFFWATRPFDRHSERRFFCYTKACPLRLSKRCFFCNHAPSTGTGSGGLFCCAKACPLNLSKRCFFCNHAPSTGSGSGSFFLRQNSFAELVEGNIPKKNDSWKKWGS